MSTSNFALLSALRSGTSWDSNPIEPQSSLSGQASALIRAESTGSIAGKPRQSDTAGAGVGLLWALAKDHETIANIRHSVKFIDKRMTLPDGRFARTFSFDYGPIDGKPAFHFNADAGPFKIFNKWGSSARTQPLMKLFQRAANPRYLKWAGRSLVGLGVASDVYALATTETLCVDSFSIAGKWGGGLGGAIIGSSMLPGPGTIIVGAAGSEAGGFAGRYFGAQVCPLVQPERSPGEDEYSKTKQWLEYIQYVQSIEEGP